MALHRIPAQEGLRNEQEVLRRQVFQIPRLLLRRPADGGHGDGRRLPLEWRRERAGLGQDVGGGEGQIIERIKTVGSH